MLNTVFLKKYVYIYNENPPPRKCMVCTLMKMLTFISNNQERHRLIPCKRCSWHVFILWAQFCPIFLYNHAGAVNICYYFPIVLDTFHYFERGPIKDGLTFKYLPFNTKDFNKQECSFEHSLQHCTKYYLYQKCHLYIHHFSIVFLFYIINYMYIDIACFQCICKKHYDATSCQMDIITYSK